MQPDKSSLFRKQIALPQDHGSWVFILSPLIIGIFAGKGLSLATISLILAVMAAFLLRQPMTAIVKSYSGRRPPTDLPAAYLWVMIYGALALLALAVLLWLGYGYVGYLAIPGIPVFAWYLWLVSKRAERRQAGVEIIATGVLSLASPAAFWVGIGRYDPTGWWLWLLTWLQSAASIVYAYLRLEQRALAEVPVRREQLRMGSRALVYTSFNFFLSLGLGFLAILPRFIFVPFLIQWLESICGVFNPAFKTKPVVIGIRLLVVSMLWTILFIVFWRS